MAGKKIVVVGGSYGAMDMVIMLSKKVKEFYLVCNLQRKPWWYSEQNVKGLAGVKPRIARAEGKTVYFQDGSSVEVDSIVYATGFYQYHPLDESLQLDFNYCNCLFPIFKHVIHPKCPKIFFIGKQYDFILQSFRVHAELGCAVIDGTYQVPSENEMNEEIKRFHEKWLPEIALNLDHCERCPIFELEQGLLTEICSLAKCEPTPPEMINLFYGLFRIMRENCFNFRDRMVKKNWRDLTLADEFYLPANSSEH